MTARTKTDLKDTILNVYADVLKMIEDAELIRDESKTQWSDICDFIQPRLARIEEFHDELDEFDYYPFGVGIITHFVIVRPGEDGMVTRIRSNVREKWGKTVEELFEKAMGNFANVTDGMELVGTDKPRQYLWNEKGVDFAATSILLGGMRFLIAETIGAPFRFGIPSSYVLYSWAELEDEEFQVEMKALMEREYKRLPARLSMNIYEVDDTGQIKQLKNQPEIPKTPDFSNN
jgi:hypothetical protein